MRYFAKKAPPCRHGGAGLIEECCAVVGLAGGQCPPLQIANKCRPSHTAPQGRGNRPQKPHFLFLTTAPTILTAAAASAG